MICVSLRGVYGCAGRSPDRRSGVQPERHNTAPSPPELEKFLSFFVLCRNYLLLGEDSDR